MSLIVVPGQRDADVHELVQHFDRLAGKHKDWDNMSAEDRFSVLKKAEREAIAEQVSECAADFSYSARNYFWITNKSGQDLLFTLWESQWLILQKYHELKAKGKAQKIMVLKARQLGASLLIEAMIAWRTMFYPNTNALVVSVDADHAGYLFSLMLHIYDNMPWWLKPQRASRKEEEGLWFDNPDEHQRRLKPGMNSRISVQHSNQNSGVGQGRRVSCAHASEYTDWLQKNAEEIIEADLGPAISDNPESFAFLESTGRGAGTYSHKLWRSCETLGERADWYPLFLPFFFESTRVMAPPGGWRPQKQEALIQKRVKDEWVRCDHCNQYMPSMFGGESRIGITCTACNIGTMTSYLLTKEQMFWKETRRINAESKGKESLKKHTAEYATTAEQAWQLSGTCVFDEICQEMATYTIRDPNKCEGIKIGYLDSHKRFHGMDGKRCYVDGCKEDHRFDDCNFIVWEMPQAGRFYSVGVDIAEGIEQDSSVINVNKIGRGGAPDEQVAVWRSSSVDPLGLAFFCNAIGLMYNEALMCIEYNTGFRTTGNAVRFQYMYPNLFRWKHLDSSNPLSNKWHWMTQYNTKHLLWQTFRKWVKAGLFLIRSPNTLAEMLTFQKDEDDDRSAGHEKGSHDDELMSCMISLYCAHEMDADESGRIPTPASGEEETETARYRMWCTACKFGTEKDENDRYPWGAANPEHEYRCPKCNSIQIHAEALEVADNRGLGFDQAMSLLDRKAPSAGNGPTMQEAYRPGGGPGEQSSDMY